MACKELDIYNDPCLSWDARSRKKRKPLWIDIGRRSSPALKEGLTRDQQGSPLLYLVKECGKQKDLSRAGHLHDLILERGLFAKNIALGNALISTYANCGALAKAQELFNQLPARNVVTWNALIAAYTHHGLGHDALNCFQCMQDEGLSPNSITFICVLKACGVIGAIKMGEAIHAEVGRQGLLEGNAALGTALLDMYVKCRVLPKAQAVFDQLPSRNEVLWNVLLGAYIEHGLNHKALSCFERMQEEGLSPTAATYKCILKVCAGLRATKKGEAIYTEISSLGLLGKDPALGTALVDMFAKCGALSRAQAIFDKLPTRNAATWTALIHGYAEHGLGNEALSIFGQMQDKGIGLDTITYVCILKACGSIGALQQGEQIHMEIRRQGLLEEDSIVGTALVDMYCDCGALDKAQGVINSLPAQTAATWNAMLSGYVQHGLADEAIYCFQQMSKESVCPSPITYTCILKACGIVGAAEMGKILHFEVSRKGFLEMDILLGAALLDMYINCGDLARAQELFEELCERNVALFTVLMAGYAQAGRVTKVFDIFLKMVGESIQPNMITFTIFLSACSHAGLVEEGQICFETMTTAYCIYPTLEHWNSMVDLFSRAGHFEKAIHVIEMVPPADCLLPWSSLMGACQQWGNVELGRWAFDNTVLMDKRFDTAYVCMRNIYAAAGLQQEAIEIETLRMGNGAWKWPQLSCDKCD